MKCSWSQISFSSRWTLEDCRIVDILMLIVLSILAAGVQPSSGSHGLGEGMKVWRQNTNFGNARNWEGLVNENCSRNIFSFPGWMDPSVVAFPSSFIGKQIILPVNGHFVFQPGLTTLSDSGTCQHGREVKFLRTTRLDWFDPKNWLRNDTDFGMSTEEDKAVPHVERIPCQFDAVKFPGKSTFNLIIPQKVAIGKFFLGDQEQTYTDIAVMMNSKLGKLQFEKRPEVDFTLTKNTCSDDDQCICDNYKQLVKQKICSLSQCQSHEDEEECHNPILPHGFCCPICGFHLKIKHNGELKLEPVHKMLKQLVLDSGKIPRRGVEYHVSRYQMKGAHVIIIPMKNYTSQTIKILAEITAYLKKLPQVLEVTWNGSWEDTPADADKWTSEGLNGGVITLIVILILSLLIGIACLIFYRAKGTYPPLTLASVSNLMPNFTLPNIGIPKMQMPNINIPLPGRSGSTAAGGRTFGFARFSNERVSTVNIERSAGSIERGEAVDETINPIDAGVPLEKVTDASNEFGFTSVTCDIIGVTDDSSSTELNPLESGDSTSGSKELSNKRQNVESGPSKPKRILPEIPQSQEESICHDLIEVTDDTVAILQPDIMQKFTEE